MQLDRIRDPNRNEWFLFSPCCWFLWSQLAHEFEGFQNYEFSIIHRRFRKFHCKNISENRKIIFFQPLFFIKSYYFFKTCFLKNIYILCNLLVSLIYRSVVSDLFLNHVNLWFDSLLDLIFFYYRHSDLYFFHFNLHSISNRKQLSIYFSLWFIKPSCAVSLLISLRLSRNRVDTFADDVTLVEWILWKWIRVEQIFADVCNK